MSDPQPDMWARPRGELFDVVLVRDGVNPLDAKVEDFKRVGVSAGSPTEAMSDPEVAKVEGFSPLQAVNPSAPQEHEEKARQRERDKGWGGEIDRTKL
jgi:hypothetical protein